MTNTDQGREGVKNPKHLADVICAWPLIRNLEPVKVGTVTLGHLVE